VASGALEQMVRFCAPGALVEYLRPGEEFWGPRRTFRCVVGWQGLFWGGLGGGGGRLGRVGGMKSTRPPP
jgi:hypothetical protein